jgi:transcriptional regulator with XRE-family HTH domain
MKHPQVKYPRLRDLREDRDWTQARLARMLNMSQTGYSKYETGENDVPTQVLIQLAKIYSTSIDYLLGETQNPKRNE